MAFALADAVNAAVWMVVVDNGGASADGVCIWDGGSSHDLFVYARRRPTLQPSNGSHKTSNRRKAVTRLRVRAIITVMVGARG